MNKTFKQFFYKTLLETPMNTGEFESEYSDYPIAAAQYKDIIGNPEYVLVDTFYPDTHSVYLYEKRDGNDVVVYFVPKNDNFIYGYVSFEEIPDGGAVMMGVYNNPTYHGLAKGVYNRYLIPKYKYIMSSGKHSPMGKSFWCDIITSNSNKKIEIWDFDNQSPVMEIENSLQARQFYGDGEDFERYRIKISK